MGKGRKTSRGRDGKNEKVGRWTDVRDQRTERKVITLFTRTCLNIKSTLWLPHGGDVNTEDNQNLPPSRGQMISISNLSSNV